MSAQTEAQRVFRGDPISPVHQPDPQEIVPLFGQVGGFTSDEFTSNTTAFANGTQVVRDGVLGVTNTADTSPSTSDGVNAAGIHFFALNKRKRRVFEYLKTIVADGETFPISQDGLWYKRDESKTGSASVTNDLSVDGVTHAGDRQPGHYGLATLSAAHTMETGDILAGYGARKTVLTNSASTAAISAQGGSGYTKHYGIDIRDLKVDTSDYAVTTGVGIDVKNQGMFTIRRTEVEGHQAAGLKSEAVVGMRKLFNNWYRNNIAEHYVSPDSQGANTTIVSVGDSRSWMDIGIKNEGSSKQYVSFGGVWENFNKLIDGTGSFSGWTSIGEWFEGYGTGRVVVAGDGTTSIGTATDSKIDMGGVCNPNLFAPYFSGEPEITNAFNPRIERGILTPSGGVAEAYAKSLTADGQFEMDISEAFWGAAATGETSFGLKTNYPTHGSLSTPDEHFYKSGTFDSVATANQAGIWNGACGGATNYVWKAIGDNTYPGATNRLYWPYSSGSPTRTTGQSDPYGGTDAVQVDDGTYATSNLPFATDGGVWSTVVVVYRAVTANDVLDFGMYHVGGAGENYSKTIQFEVPDTDWRIANFTQYLPASSGINFRTRLGTTSGGSIQFARIAVFEGAKALPPLNLEQQITEPLAFDFGNVILNGSAAPSSGKFYAGDKVRYRAPTASGKIGTVCVTTGSPGTWKEYGAIDA